MVEAFEGLAAGRQKSLTALLKGEFALAQQVTIEEANPAFDAVLTAMSAFQEESAVKKIPL